MTVTTTKNEGTLNVALSGRLDTTTAPQLEKILGEELGGIDNLAFDFKELEYISSAGLRILLSAQKKMNTQGKMTITNVCDEISEVFVITGFSDILTII